MCHYNPLENLKVRAFNSDWYGVYTKNYTKQERKKEHRNTKDDPRKQFEYSTSKRKWRWVEIEGVNQNSRYQESIASSVEYLGDTMKLIN